MKKFLKISCLILIAAISAVSLSGCGKQTTTTPNKIVVWSFEDPDVWKPIAKSFASSNKGWTMEYQQQTFDSTYENRALNSILSGQGPDVWAMPNDWVYRHKEKLAPMPDALVKTTKLDDRFVPAIKQSVQFDNKIYALSPSAEPLILYSNTKVISDTLNETSVSTDKAFKTKASKLLSDTPKTWTDFVEATKILTKKNGSNIAISGVAMGSSRITNSQDILYLLMKQNDTDILSSDLSQSTFNLPKSTSTGKDDTPGKRATEFYTSFANSASANYSWNDALGSDVDAFANGKAAFIFGYSSLQNTFLQKYPSIKYKRAYVPQLTGEASKITDYARFNAFGVSKLSKNTAIAWNAIEVLVEDNADDYNSANRVISSKKSSSYDVTLENRSGTSPDKLELATASSLIRGRYPYEFDIQIRNMISSVNTGTLDVPAALDLASSKITENLRKTNW